MNPATSSLNFFPSFSIPYSASQPQFPVNSTFNAPGPSTIIAPTPTLDQVKFSQQPIDRELIIKDTSSSKDVSHTKQTSKRKGHDCPICGKNFRQKPVLKTHMKIHSEQKEHICRECGKSFTYKANMDVHMRVHTGERPHICCHCGKGFSQANSLKYHLSTHTGFKPFSCPLCQKSFVTKANLRDHMITHSSEKPFTCDVCGHSFARKVSLRFHSRLHSNYKPYKCKYCDNSFAASPSLIYHNQIHCGPHSRKHLNNLISEGNKNNEEFDLLENELLNQKHSKDLRQGRQISCECACGKTFKSNFLYLDHKETCHYAKNIMRKCPECHMICKDENALTEHQNQHRLDKIAAEELQRDNLHELMGGNSIQGQRCTVCNAKFVDKDQLLLHYQQHLNSMCNKN